MEFALVLPVLVLILLGLIQLAFVFGSQIGITNAVREAARDGSSFVTVSGSQASTNGSWTYNELRNVILPTYVQTYSASRLVTSGSPGVPPLTQVCYDTYTDAANTTQVQITVNAVYSHPLFLPIVSNVLDLIDGVSDNGLRVSASEVLRVENQPKDGAPSLSTTCVTS